MTERGRSIKQFGIREHSRLILLRGQDIHPTRPESDRDGAGHMHVHVNGHAHRSLPKARSR